MDNVTHIHITSKRNRVCTHPRRVHRQRNRRLQRSHRHCFCIATHIGALCGTVAKHGVLLLRRRAARAHKRKRQLSMLTLGARGAAVSDHVLDKVKVRGRRLVCKEFAVAANDSVRAIGVYSAQIQSKC